MTKKQKDAIQQAIAAMWQPVADEQLLAYLAYRYPAKEKP